MSKSRPRCLIHGPMLPPTPVKALKFAVISEDELAVSGIWSVYPHSNRRKPDIFVTSSGMNGSAKFTFHNDVLNHSWLGEKHSQLIEEGVAQKGSRHWQQLPITGLPWHGLTVRFVHGLLRKEGYGVEQIRGEIVALPAPKHGKVLDVGFILAEGSSLNVKGAQFAIGEVGGGGRALVVVGRYSNQDTDEQNKEIKRIVESVQASEILLKKVATDDKLAMLMFGEEGGAIVVTEVHDVRLRER